MTRVRFYLPLDPRHVFLPAALQQLADLLGGTPVYLADEGGGAAGEPVGRLESAVVEGDRVRCWADVEDRYAEVIGGYGVDGHVDLERGKPWPVTVSAVHRASIVLVRPDMLPPGAEKIR